MAAWLNQSYKGSVIESIRLSQDVTAKFNRMDVLVYKHFGL